MIPSITIIYHTCVMTKKTSITMMINYTLSKQYFCFFVLVSVNIFNPNLLNKLESTLIFYVFWLNFFKCINSILSVDLFSLNDMNLYMS